MANKGKPNGKTTDETTWYLITDLPLSVNVPDFRSESATRDGLHQLIVQLVLTLSLLGATLLAVTDKSVRPQQLFAGAQPPPADTRTQAPQEAGQVGPCSRSIRSHPQGLG